MLKTPVVAMWIVSKVKEQDGDALQGAVQGRPPFDLAKALKVVNLDFDRHSVASRGMAGVVHAAKTYGEEVPRVLWQARCGWKFGRKANKYGKAWKKFGGERGPGTVRRV